MAESNKNLWAPWRMEYIGSLNSGVENRCFLCRYWAEPDADQRNYVVWRTKAAFVVMNRFPYSNGHLMVALAEHVGDFATLSDDTLMELSRNLRGAATLLQKVVAAQGFNIGYNVGPCAGAGLPGHLHGHVVPRWSGDTNYMAVVSDTRVISESLDALYVRLAEAARSVGLRP